MGDKEVELVWIKLLRHSEDGIEIGDWRDYKIKKSVSFGFEVRSILSDVIKRKETLEKRWKIQHSFSYS